jgi:hypothetical protein
MTVLDISPTAQQEEAPIAGTESNDDAQRLQLMEAMLRDRGYSRNIHGFWGAPGSRLTAAKAGSESIATDTDSEVEDMAAVA